MKSITIYVKKMLLGLIVLLYIPQTGQCEGSICPKPNDTIYQTDYLFKVPYLQSAVNYEIQIGLSEDAFDTDTIFYSKSADNYFLVDKGLQFQTMYCWRYRCYDKNGKIISISPVMIFFIAGIPAADTSKYRNTITVNNINDKNGLIAIDNGTIIDRNGKTVWALPPKLNIDGIRALQLNDDGNITFIDKKNCYEIDLSGNIIWQGPDIVNGIRIKNYHHEFRKLGNGNYLCVAEKEGHYVSDVTYSIVFEITKENKVMWMWDEEKFYPSTSTFKGAHLNAAYYNIQTHTLYISNRDLNSIAAINTTSGDILYSIGYDYGKGIPFYSNTFFNQQHAVGLTSKNEILLFNNNSLSRTLSSSVMTLPQPKQGDVSKPDWEYAFNFSRPEENHIRKLGSAIELDNGNILICTGATGHIFEVNIDKAIVWECWHEKKDSITGTFKPEATGYRATYAKTLYPYAFVAYKQLIDGKNKLSIKNIGSFSDSYECIITTKKGKSVIKTDPVQNGVSISIDLPQHSSIIVRSEKNNQILIQIP